MRPRHRRLAKYYPKPRYVIWGSSETTSSSWDRVLPAMGACSCTMRDRETRLGSPCRRSRGATSDAHARRTAHEERLRAVEDELTTTRIAAGEAQARATAGAARAGELAARALHDVRSRLLQRLPQTRDLLRLVLQVGVDGADPLAPRSPREISRGVQQLHRSSRPYRG